MAPPNRVRTIARLFIIAIILLVLLLAYTIFSSLHTLNTTGVLDVTTSESQAVITISQPNSDAEIIGVGSTKVRLLPGVYSIAASHNGDHAVTTTQLYAGRSSKANLNLAKDSTVLPTTQSTSFVNFDVLVNNGLSSSQSTNLQQLFQAYTPDAKTIVVDASTVEPGPHDPNSDDPSFSLIFTGSIDSAPYKATVQYSGFDNVQLTLTNPQTGAQLYAGYAPSSSDS